jgi:uncharacterized iron-regulated protein
MVYLVNEFIMSLKYEVIAIETSTVKTLTDVINEISNKRIIYIGEIHDAFIHHAIQLDIIRGLYRKNQKLAIGMEMFQKPFQNILDSFIACKINEKDFLEKSEYSERRGLDYNLYKPILDFARMKKIPVIALNLQREIIKKVSENGLDSLSAKEKKEIPEELDLSDSEYRERLKEIFRFHNRHFKKENFDYFYQAQILWDETMSQSIEEFLRKNSDYQMVVIAGQGHLRYGSGIPKRTFRRNRLDYAIVLIDEKIEKDIADYIVFSKEAPKFI